MDLGINKAAIQRKIKILEMLCEGYRLQEIGHSLNLPKKTIEQCLMIMKNKNGCKTTIQLIVTAIADEVIKIPQIKN